MEDGLIKNMWEYLQGITAENFSQKYDGLVTIIISYNEKGVGKQSIESTLFKFYNDYDGVMTVCQDEVFLEICNCVEGFCPPYKQIKLLSYDNSP